MSEGGHDLHSLFPSEGETLHRLKLGNAHFRSLAQRHHELALEIGRLESRAVVASDTHLEALKKQRLLVLDEVSEMLAEAAAD